MDSLLGKGLRLKQDQKTVDLDKFELNFYKNIILLNSRKGWYSVPFHEINDIT